MSTPFPTLLLAVGVLTIVVPASAGPQPAPKKQSFETYNLLRTRNIFDPERRPGSSTPVATETAPSHSDFAALTGTMITPEKTLAFFSGSRTEFNVVLSTSGTIAGAKITKINSDSVEIERNGKLITVAIGQTVPLNASSKPGPAPGFTPADSTPSTTANAAPGSSPSAQPSTDREALMRRMMEKRQQELK